ncbi:MAG: AAA family ATPase, partial [Lachnospiraceae bacterium]|nr:AAA family ATPase [Lachnospiraceae bacterium]
MTKTGKSVFFCQECGYESAKWMGQCPACHAWNTFVEEKVTEGAAKNARGTRDGVPKSRPVRLSEIESGSDERYLTGIGELDRVLGGGIVHGSLVLIGGDPGIGKSTLLLQVCLLLSAKGVPLLYVSGEESARQIKMRAERLGGRDAGMEIFCETDLDAIESVIEQKKPGIVVIDSIQTMYTADVSAAPGSV